MRGGVAASLAERAAAVLRADDAGGYTTPSRLTYPHQWNWDSALCALGWAELRPERAWLELETLAAARAPDGMLPHIAFRPRARHAVQRALPRLAAAPSHRYAPGPGWWGERRGADGRRISAITQPPLAATCMRLLFERHPDERRARHLVRVFDAWHGWLLTARDPHGLGEPVLIHPWESGRDNAAEWDEPLARVRLQVLLVRRPDTRTVGEAERPGNWHYRRFLSLVRGGTHARWPQTELARAGEFRVLDPGFSATLARACADLAWLAGELGEAEVAERELAAAERVTGALSARLSSDGTLWPVDLRPHGGAELRRASAGSALAALVPGLPRRGVEAVRRLVAEGGELRSPHGIPSLAPADAGFSPRCYWRGPVWANVAWLCALGLEGHGEAALAAELRSEMLATISRAGMREYFHPVTGAGLGAHDFAWTAALYLRGASSPAS